MRPDLAEALLEALGDAEVDRRLMPRIMDVVEATLDCRTCDGTGWQAPPAPTEDCPACHGSGLGGGR